jgi:hypothetical protein
MKFVQMHAAKVTRSKKDMEEGIADKLKAVWNDPEMLGKLLQ